MNGPHATAGGAAYREKLPRVVDTRGTPASGGFGGDDGVGEEESAGDEKKLSRAAKLIEEEREKVASVRSFLLNFLEGRDCSIKKRLVRRVCSRVLVWARSIVHSGLAVCGCLGRRIFTLCGPPCTGPGIVGIDDCLEGDLEHCALVVGACDLTWGTRLRFSSTLCATPWSLASIFKTFF